MMGNKHSSNNFTRNPGETKSEYKVNPGEI